MKQLFFILTFFTIAHTTFGQDAATLYQTGKKFLLQGDYDNAVLVLKRAAALEPENIQYAKDLTNAYLYKGDNDNAQAKVAELLEKEAIDEEVYYLAYNIYNNKGDAKNAEKVLKKGLKKFNNSGLLYDVYGQLLGQKSDASAIIQWENGIEKDPNYAGNYYQAARYYYYTSHIMAKVWAIYYAEIFINLESYTTRTVEAKTILLDCYKKIFTDESFGKKTSKNEFENNIAQTLLALKDDIATGVTTTNLVKLRAKFILFWYASNTAMPSALFQRQQQLLKEGYFEAYNYWLFEPIQNLAAFENWIKVNETSFEQFSKYHQNKLLKIPPTEYYKLKN